MCLPTAQVLFGTFTPSEVHDLFRSESSALEVTIFSTSASFTLSLPLCLQFGWQRKKRNNCLHHSLLKTPEKVTPRCYNLGGSSPNLPRNPPTTPVSELNSRGTSPNPTMPSKLNANAPPFIPCSSPEPGNETASGMEQELSSVRAALEERLATPTNRKTSGSEFVEECSTPIQTVGVPTPSLPSVVGGVVSDDEAGTSDSSPPTLPKTWASIVSKSGSGSQPVATPTLSVEVKEEEKGEREGGDREGEETSVSAASLPLDSSGPKPSAHLTSLGGG